MINKTSEIVLASVPDREGLVAEIWVDGGQIAEVRLEGDTVVVDIFSNPTARTWEIKYSDLIDLLHAAKQKLSGPTS